jgi:hypothetical protein
MRSKLVQFEVLVNWTARVHENEELTTWWKLSESRHGREKITRI